MGIVHAGFQNSKRLPQKCDNPFNLKVKPDDIGST
jgi:hypothetical protein